MISYIFKSKIKNILVAIFSALVVCINLKEVRAYMIFASWGNMILKFISLIPYVLIFLYMTTLKRDYKFKRFLFPISFAIFILTTIVSIPNCFDEYTFSSINGLVRLFVNLVIKFVLIVGYVLCFVGTMSNFKRTKFLRWGLLICIILIVIQGLTYHYLVDWIGNAFYSILYSLSETSRATMMLLFYISVFALTLTKKGEYIDIMPFVEDRKMKKQIKKANKIAGEVPEEFTPPVVEDGYWRCMGCGEILADTQNRCKCGYKKQ